jgi:hypothetical protein
MHLRILVGAEERFPRILLCVIKVWNVMIYLKKVNHKLPEKENGRNSGRIGGLQVSRRILRWKTDFRETATCE